MIYALDTNIISYILKGDMGVINRFHEEIGQPDNEAIIPPVVFYEVQRWLSAYSLYKKQRHFDALCLELGIGEFNYFTWKEAANIYANLKRQGNPLSNNDGDYLIAAFCIINGCTLVTNNTSHFERITGLRFVNWKIN
jgi:predicted nucleic acid-binding protein